MNEKWETLLTVLQESVMLYKGLLLLGEEKRQALVEAQSAELDAVTRREELMILEGARLEERRAKVTAALATHYNTPGTTPTISMLSAVAEPEMAQRLQFCKAELDDAVQRLLRLNETNGALIRQALHFVNYNLNLLTQCQAETTYGSNGGRAGGDKGSAAMILDRTV